MGEKLLSDEFRVEITKKMITGIAICGSPFEMEMILDYTNLRGSGSNIYYSYIFQLPKWGYTIKKVDEWIEVTPEWAEYYSLTIGQKQKLMEQIKTGLTSAASAVTDYELAMHDVRRYREILDYFKTKDQHVLRSLFVDRVDAYTGEGYSLVTMARRWPTIITDFIRMEEELDSIDEIRKKLDVSQAEATVLKTKNSLFREWKKMFFPVVKERYARMENMANARKKSIDEYKNWMKPYMAKFKLMEEKTEIKPTLNVSNPYMTPGFGQTQAVTGVKLWAWKPYFPSEYRRPELGPLRDCEFRVPAKDKPGKFETKKLQFVVNPYDDLVKEQQKKIAEYYGVSIDEGDVYNILKAATTPNISGLSEMDKYSVYYILFEVNLILNLLKTPPPQGFETDNLMFMPIKAWWMSQNILLVHLIEIFAREKAFEKYIREMLGAPELEKEIVKHVEEEFKEPEKPGKLAPVRNFFKKPKVQKMGKGSKALGGAFRRGMDRVLPAVVRRGPYETVFFERVSKMFARGIGGEYGVQIDFLKRKMGIP